MKKIIVILWILLMVATLANMALENKINRLEDENFKLYAEVQSLKEIVEEK